jgi:hypothetical protein
VTKVRGSLGAPLLVGAAGAVEVSSVEVEIVGVTLPGVTPVTVGWVVVAMAVGPGDGTQAASGDTIRIKKSMNTI